MKLRIGRVLAGTMALASAAVMATAGSASAAQLPPVPSGGWDHVWSGTGVKVYFEEHGDLVSVCDTKANGHSAWVSVIDNDSSNDYKSTVTTGAGTCVNHAASQGGKYNLAEGHLITFNFEGEGGGGSYVANVVNDH